MVSKKPKYNPFGITTANPRSFWVRMIVLVYKLRITALEINFTQVTERKKITNARGFYWASEVKSLSTLRWDDRCIDDDWLDVPLPAFSQQLSEEDQQAKTRRLQLRPPPRGASEWLPNLRLIFRLDGTTRGMQLRMVAGSRSPSGGGG